MKKGFSKTKTFRQIRISVNTYMRIFFFLLLLCRSFQSHSQELMINYGHTDAIYDPVFSNDGKLILTFSDDATVKVWDRRSGRLLRFYESPSGGRITNAALSDDNQILAFRDFDYNKIYWYTIGNGQLIHSIENYNSNDNHFFGVAARINRDNNSQKIEVYDAMSDSVQKTIQGNYFYVATDLQKGLMYALERSSQQTITVKCFSFPAGIPLDREFVFSVNNKNISFDFFKRELLAFCDGNTIQLVDLNTFKRYKTISTGSYTIRDIMFSSNDATLIACYGADSSASILQTTTNRLTPAIKYKGEEIKSDSYFSPQNDLFIIKGARKSKLTAIDTRTGKEVNYFLHTDSVHLGNYSFLPTLTQLIFLPGSNEVAANYDGAVLKIFSGDNYQIKQEKSFVNNWLGDIVISPDQTDFLSYYSSGSSRFVSLLSLQSLEKKYDFFRDETYTTTGYYDPQEALFFYGQYKDTAVCTFDFSTMEYKRYAYSNSRGLEELGVLLATDEKKLIGISKNNDVFIWQRPSMAITGKFKAHNGDITTAQALCPNGKYLAIGTRDKQVSIWNTDSLSLYKNFGQSDKEFIDEYGNTNTFFNPESVNFDQWPSQLLFSPEGKYLLSVGRSKSAYNELVLVDVNKKKAILQKDISQGTYNLAFSPSCRHFLAGSDRVVQLYSTDSLKAVFNLIDTSYAYYRRHYSTKTGVTEFTRLANISGTGFLPDGDFFICFSNGYLSIRDIVTFREKASCFFKGDKAEYDTSTGNVLIFQNGILQYALAPDLQTVIPAGKLLFGNDLVNGDIQLFPGYLSKEVPYFRNGKKAASLYIIGNDAWIIVDSNRYYLSSKNTVQQLNYVTSDLKVITFEQLDVKYNRPDKVLEVIGNTDTTLINLYRRAYEKRIKKLGIDTTQFRDGYSVPEADFKNRAVIDFEQTADKLTLKLRGNDNTYKLDRFNIWVNEAPLYGQRGISLKKKKANSIDTTITITLSQGENRIETSITNVNGTESYRMPLYVNYTPVEKQKEMTRFIGIGIDKFSESKYDLQYSSKDIRDLAKKLKEKYKDEITIDTLFNENVTVSNVKALKQKLQQASVNDKVIISYSGHGLLSKDYDYYLSTYNVNFNKPEENGLAYDELENLLDSIPARKKLMLIDACHSGEVDKDERMAMQKMADSLGLSKGIILDDSTTQTQQVGLKNSFELMQSLFVNVGKSTGATIISAAAGNQFALERGDLKNGVFTYSILEAMEMNPTMKISELKKIVGERVEQLTNGMQKPTSRNENIAVDWNIW